MSEKMQSINVNQPTIKPDPFKPETTCSDLTTSDFFFISSPLTFTHSTPKIGNLLPQIHSNNKNGSLNQFSNIPKLNLSEGLEQGGKSNLQVIKQFAGCKSHPFTRIPPTTALV